LDSWLCIKDAKVIILRWHNDFFLNREFETDQS
jgi:hypothetical protein